MQLPDGMRALSADGAMPMDFFQRQELARTNSRKMVLLFLLALPGVVAAVYVVSLAVYGVGWAFFAFWRSVISGIDPAGSGASAYFISPWQPHLLLWVSAATLAIIAWGSLYEIKHLTAGGRVVALRLGGERLNPETKKLDELRLLHVVEEMSVASGTPVPDIYILRREFGLNAFVAGHSVSDTIVCATEGCLRSLTRDELQGVIAHEYSHILNGDMRLNMRLMGLVHGLFCITLSSYWIMSRTYRESDRDICGAPHSRSGLSVVVDLGILALGFLLAFIGWNAAFFGRMIKGAVSRQREFLADAAAVQFTRYPEGLASALKKVKKTPDGSLIHSPWAEEASHIFFCNGIEEDRMWLTSTHPPVDERIQRIQTMMGPCFVPDGEGSEVQAAQGGGSAEEPERVSGGFVSRLLSPKGADSASDRAGIAATDALTHLGVPVARHLAYAALLMEALPESVRRAARDPHGAIAVAYVLLLSPIESVREAQLRLLKSRIGSDAGQKINAVLSALRELDESIKIPLVELALPALRQLSLPQYAAFMENIGALIAADQQVDLFEFALKKMLRRHLEPKFKPTPRPEVRYSRLGELSAASSTLLSALAHAGHDTTEQAQSAFESGVRQMQADDARLQFVALADCTFEALEAALYRLAEATMQLKKRFLTGCAQTVAFDGRIRAREAELLRAIADSLDCPMPPFVAVS